MKNKNQGGWLYAIPFLAGLIYLLMKTKKNTSALEYPLENKAADFIIPLEGFRSRPYWDVKQWSIGYGTGIGYVYGEKPNVEWTKTVARQHLLTRLFNDLKEIRKRLTVSVNENQLIALLSFAYNLGLGNAYKIVNYLNNKTPKEAVAATMRKYFYAGGVPNEDLKARREKEAKLFLS